MDALFVSSRTGLVTVTGDDLPRLLESIAARNPQRPSLVVLDVDGTIISDRKYGKDVAIHRDMPGALASLGDDWVFLTAGQAPNRGIADPGILGPAFRIPPGNSYTDTDSLMNQAVVGLTDVPTSTEALPGTYIDAQDKKHVVVRLTRLLRMEYLVNQEAYMESMRRDYQYRWAISEWQKLEGDPDREESIALLQKEIEYEAGRRQKLKADLSDRPVVYFFDDNQFIIESTIRKTREFGLPNVFSIHVLSLIHI